MRPYPGPLPWWLIALSAVVVTLLVQFFLGLAFAMSPITGALESAQAEASGPIVTAVAAILATVVLIGVGAGIVRAITRSQ